MGAHSRPKGMHRGETAPIVDIDLSLGTRKLGAATGVAVVAAGAAVALAPAAGAAATPDDFARLRMCESGGNYATNTGNGYYGAYQFSLQTWRGMGNTGLPSDASPAEQDAQAARLQAARGWQPWPACSRKLGLSSGPSVTGASASKPVVIRGTKVTSRSAPFVPTTPPAFGDVTLNAGLIGEQRADVRAWQTVMRSRGWSIAVDGYFGPQSASIARAFAAEKGIPTGSGGVVDLTMWDAAWTLPVT